LELSSLLVLMTWMLLGTFLLSLGIPWMLLGAFLLITFVSHLIDHRFLSAEEACCFS
jgi:hypothetical protein